MEEDSYTALHLEIRQVVFTKDLYHAAKQGHKGIKGSFAHRTEVFVEWTDK